MRFSILIPVYNVERYLAQCFESVDSQSFTDYEVVLVNDGSTDSSTDICREYAASHPGNVRLIEQENRGLLMARRAAIDAAEGEYIVCLDSDDMLRCDALEVLDAAIEKTQADLVVFNASRSERFDVPLLDHSALLKRLDNSGLAPISVAQEMLCSSHELNQMWGKAIRRECAGVGTDYRRYEGIQLGEDVVQVAEVVDRAHNVTAVDESLVYYRLNTTSIGRSLDPKCCRDIERAYQCLEEYAKKWDDRMVGDVLAMECVSLLSRAFKMANRQGRAESLDNISEVGRLIHTEELATRANLARLNTWKRAYLWMLSSGHYSTFRLLVRMALRVDGAIGLNSLKPWG